MFRGSMVALVTPLLNDGIDIERLRELVEFHIAAGTHAIIAAGTTGEAGTLSFSEKQRVIKTVVEQANDRLPIIAGTAANATKDCIELTRMAMACGACAALIMTPAYIKPSQQGLYQHYRQIALSVAIPIILYNVPSRTACDLLPETVMQLAKISNIIAIKEATSDSRRLQALLVGCKDRLDIYSGDDITAAQWLLAGSKGVISVTANIVPKQMVALCYAALNGDEKTCLAINEQLMPLHQSLFIESNPIPTKWALSQMGLISNELRLPLMPLATSNQLTLDSVIRKLDLI
jgi:4-hydroxy-tetrahydrodipicolinate synthase